jgi:hypothetical protein
MSSITLVNKQRRPRQRRGRGAKKRTLVVNQNQNQRPRRQQVVAVKTLPPPGRRRRNRNNRKVRNGLGWTQASGMADTSSKFLGGNVVRNSRKLSKPEPFSGDELITSLNGSVAFATNAFVLNPGNATTFPWFNQIAKLYERYKFTMLEFYFQHDVSQFAAQGAQGLVLLSALYDAASAAPTTKVQVEATDPHAVAMPNENIILSLAVQGMHPSGEPKFVRPGALPGATDIKTYDAGTLYASTQGMAGATEVGELHVRYRGLLYDRILDSSATTAPQNFSVSLFETTVPEALVTGVQKTMLVATATANGLNVVNTAGSIVLPAGNFLMDYDCQFTNPGNNCTQAECFVTKNAALITDTDQQFAGPALASITVSATSFVTSNGTDAFKLVALAVFGAGAQTAAGSIRFVAI